MKIIIVKYERISPAVLESIIMKAFNPCLCNWFDIDEDSFEFHVFGVSDLEMLEDVLAEYV